MPKDEQERLFGNAAASMNGVPAEIQTRACARFYLADERCGLGIAAKLGIDAGAVKTEAERLKKADEAAAKA